MTSVRHSLHRVALAAIVTIAFSTGWSQTTPSSANEVLRLPDFTVNAKRDVGYATASSAGGTRVVMENRNTPLSLITLNRQFLDDVAPANIQEAIKYVSGVTSAAAPNVGQITLRGFNSNGSVHRDGLEDAIVAFGAVLTDTSTIERIEVVKGPVGTLYGRQNVGGVVNRISKMPQRTRATSLAAGVDSFGMLRGELDTTGPMGETSAYRLVLAEQQGENMQGGRLDKRVLYSSLSGRIGEVDWYLRLLHERDRVSANTSPWFADRDGVPSTFLSRDRSLVPLDDLRDFEVNSVDLGLERPFELAGNLGGIRAVVRYSELDTFNINYPLPTILITGAGGASLGNINTTPFSIAGATGFRVTERRREQPIAIETASLDLDIVYNFKLGPSDHKLLTYGRLSRNQNQSGDLQFDHSTLDIVGNVYTSTALAPTVRFNRKSRSEDSGMAWAMQDYIRFFDERLVVLVGGRYDSFEYEEKTTNLLLGTPTVTQKVEPSNWTYNYGVVFKPIETVSVFANHSETFNLPTPLINGGTGQVFKNLEGNSDEFGVKAELWESKLTATGSVFKIEQTNQIAAVVNQPGVLVQDGVTQVDGFELDLVFQPVPEVSILAAYGWMDSKTTTTTRAVVRSRSVAQGSSYKAFGKYAFLDGTLKGLELGVGYEYVNDRAGDSADGFNLTPYDTVDAMLIYRVNKHLRLQLNVQNVTDATYVLGAVSRQLVHPGNERNFRFSAHYRF